MRSFSIAVWVSNLFIYTGLFSHGYFFAFTCYTDSVSVNNCSD